MACRNEARAEVARTKLLKSLDAHISKLRRSRADFEYATLFRQNVEIAIHKLDLSDIHSVFEFKNEVSQKYVHGLLHLYCIALVK